LAAREAEPILAGGVWAHRWTVANPESVNVFAFDQTVPGLSHQTGQGSGYADPGPDGAIHNLYREGTHMNPSTKDEIKGKFHEVKGKVKQKVGQVTNNPDLEAEGKSEHISGKIEKKIGQIEKVLEK